MDVPYGFLELRPRFGRAAGARRQHAQIRQPQVVQPVRRVDPVVEPLQDDHEADGDQGPAEQAGQHEHPQRPTGGPDRHFGFVEDSRTDRGQIGDYVRFLDSPQDPLVELPGPLGVALQRAVLDAFPAYLGRLGLRGFDLRLKLPFFGRRQQVLVALRFDQLVDFVVDSRRGDPDGPPQLAQIRMAVAQRLGQLGLLAPQRREIRFLALYDAVRQDVGERVDSRGVATELFQPGVVCFLPDPSYRGLGRRHVQIHDLPDDDGLSILDGSAVVTFQVLLNRKFRRRNLLALLLDVPAQRFMEVPQHLDPGFRHQSQILAGRRVRHLGRQVRVPGTERDVDQAAVPDRRDTQIAEEAVGGPRPGSFGPGRFPAAARRLVKKRRVVVPAVRPPRFELAVIPQFEPVERPPRDRPALQHCVMGVEELA